MSVMIGSNAETDDETVDILESPKIIGGATPSATIGKILDVNTIEDIGDQNVPRLTAS